MKKILAYVLTATLTISMFTGCGTKKENEVTMSMNEIIENCVKSFGELKSAEIDLLTKADAEISYQGKQDASVKGEVSGEFEANLEEPSFHLDGTMKYEAKINMNGIKNTSSAEENLEIYAEESEEQLELYTKLNDESWKKHIEDMDDFDELIKNIGELKEIDIEDVDELDEAGAMDFAKLESKTKFTNDTECYVVHYKLDKDIYMKLLQSDKTLLGESSVTVTEKVEEAVEGIKDFSLVLDIYIDVKTYTPVKANLDIELDADFENTQVKINELSFEVNLKTNEAMPIEIPSDIKDAALEEDEY